MTTLTRHSTAQVSPTCGLQEKIDALGEAGGTVEMPAGEFVLRRPLMPGPRVTLRGGGAATVLRIAEPVITPLIEDTVVGLPQVRVADASHLRVGDAACLFEPRGNRWYNCAYIEVTAIEGQRITCRTLHHNKPDLIYRVSQSAVLVTAFPAVLIYRAPDVTLSGFAVEGPGAGPVRVGEYLMTEEFMHAAVIVHGSPRTRIADLTVSRSITDGICVGGGTSDAIVTGCVAEYCGGIGLHTGGGIQGAQFLNNISRHNHSGFLFCQGNRHVICASNLVHHNVTDGIWGLNDTDKFNIVANNVCHHNGRYGIEANTSIGNVIQGNICRNNSQSAPGKYAGIQLAKHKDNLVTGNYCVDDQEKPTQTTGIASIDPAGDNRIENNTQIIGAPAGSAPPDYQIERQVLREGYDRQTEWFQPRVGIIPPGTAVLTVSKSFLWGNDVFAAIHEMRSEDFGRTWSDPAAQATLDRRKLADGVEECPCDLVPQWHRKTGKLLAIGARACYATDAKSPISHGGHPTTTVWSVYDSQARTWSPWRELQMPDRERFHSYSAGCSQVVETSSGDVLIPLVTMDRTTLMTAGSSWKVCHRVVVARCTFDGQTLRYVEHGNEMTVSKPRGLCEPSLTCFNGRYYLTLRNDEKAYITSGEGLQYDLPKPWLFDDGQELGSFNTQQHWVTHSDGLFLTYTRRGAGNEHVFRCRAPLFIARVDPDRLVVLRATERELVPNNGAQLGNYGTVNVSANETWVVTHEDMQGDAKDHMKLELTEARGASARLWLCRLKWNRPNRQPDVVTRID